MKIYFGLNNYFEGNVNVRSLRLIIDMLRDEWDNPDKTVTSLYMVSIELDPVAGYHCVVH